MGNLLDNFEQPMGICKLLDEKEESKVLERIGKKPREIYTENILEVFEKKCFREPDKVALVDGERQLTFSELDELSSKMANILHAKKVKKNSVIAMLFNRSLDTIISILGIL